MNNDYILLLILALGTLLINREYLFPGYYASRQKRKEGKVSG